MLKLSKKLNDEPNGAEIAIRRIQFINQHRKNKIMVITKELKEETNDANGSTQVKLRIPLEHV